MFVHWIKSVTILTPHIFYKLKRFGRNALHMTKQHTSDRYWGRCIKLELVTCKLV
jgi:hypothetical protein